MRRFYFHRAGDGRLQSGKEHLLETARLAAEFADSFGAADWGRFAGLLHDLGKYSDDYQRRLLEDGPIVDHATFGAIQAAALSCLPAAFCIAGHHGGLPDGGSLSDGPEASTLCGRLRRRVENGQLPDASAYKGEIALPPVPKPCFPFKDRFSLSFFIRMLYSCLVDADYLDTERFMSAGKVIREAGAPLPLLLERLEAYIAKWRDPKEPINQKRCEILWACLDKGAVAERGLYTLTVPTGGGKTVSSLAFALRHAVRRGMKRIVYVAPYTSIIEQTADLFRQIVGKPSVLEHHTGVQYEMGPDGALTPADIQKVLATENWDAPIVVTTAVQFFESLYACKASRCRKLHNLADSVLIIDEAQTLPLPFLKPCVAAISALVSHYRSTALLCTATQPALEGIFREYGGLEAREIAPDPAGLCAFFRRVTLVCDGELDNAALSRRLSGLGQTLCIVNNRRQAREIYRDLPADGRFCLTTLLCPADRRKRLAEIQRRLQAGEPCRVVATSLVEAGVDLDFPQVYRAESGLDAILQAAGRCNREGRRPAAESLVHIFRSQTPPPALLLPNIGAMRETANRFEDLGSPAAVRAYFQALLSLKGEQALDRQGILDGFRRGVEGGFFPFRWAADRFRLMDTPTRTLYIPVEEGAGLVRRLRDGERSRQLFRQLGAYAVNLYPPHLAALYAAGDIALLDEETAVLENMSLYDGQTGLSPEPEQGKGLFL